jgi:hypothetical protein
VVYSVRKWISMSEGEDGLPGDSILPLTSASEVTNPPALVIPPLEAQNDGTGPDSDTAKMVPISARAPLQKSLYYDTDPAGRAQTGRTPGSRTQCCLLL